MKKILALFLMLVIVISALATLASCKKDDVKPLTPPTVNGVALSEYVIVYDKEGIDYNQRAAEHIRSTIESRYNVKLSVVDDGTAKNANEIVVGETSRDISAALEAETTGFEFAILASDGSIALEGDLFVIAAAAYFFTETYTSCDGGEVTVPSEISVHKPITKEAKNFIMLIGDGMGEYQTRLFEYMNASDVDCDYSDGEDFFYGYMFPYKGYSKTDSMSGTTDSAAGGTALACGYKTLNGYVGVNVAQQPVKSLTELAYERGMSTAVMSTEVATGATPSTFLVHVTSRSYSDIILDKIYEAREKQGTVVNCGYDQYGARYIKVIESRVSEVLDAVSKNENGFFLMYEEAHIDKHCHNNYMDRTFLALIRFNQVIARFMEFAFYNPDTFVLITADHETGELYPDEDGTLAYHYDDHSSADVPVFVYGCGAELFDGKTVENIQIAHTIAALMGDDSFGDQSKFQSLTK